MMKQTKKAFTLVELIIVITILAILATIGFMSYQSYTSDARNGKRISDLSSLESKIVLFIAKTPNNSLEMVDTGVILAGAMLNNGITVASGSTTLSGGINYKAGYVNYDRLVIDKAQFSDPNYTSTNTGNYLLGVTSTTAKGNLYQLAATLESNGDEVTQSLVRGFYVSGSTSDANGLIKASKLLTGTAISASGLVNKSKTECPY